MKLIILLIGIILTAGCNENSQEKEQEVYNIEQSRVMKIFDKKENVVCYVLCNRAISCVKTKETKWNKDFTDIKSKFGLQQK